MTNLELLAYIYGIGGLLALPVWMYIVARPFGLVADILASFLVAFAWPTMILVLAIWTVAHHFLEWRENRHE